MTYPTRKKPFDQLTTIDERVDFIHSQLLEAQVALDKLLEMGGQVPMTTLTRTVNLSLTLQPLTGDRVRKPSPLDGKIVQIIPHWPDGCNALVDLAVGHGDHEWVYPNEVDTFAALNDATPVIAVNEPVSRGMNLWMECRNGDAVNAHTVSCAFVIMGVE